MQSTKPDYLLDTNIVIYLLKGDSQLSSYLHGAECVISFITKIELLSHRPTNSDSEQQIHKLLNSLNIYNYTPELENEIINIRQSYKIKLADAVILVTAHILSLPLVTADTDFSCIESQTYVLTCAP